MKLVREFKGSVATETAVSNVTKLSDISYHKIQQI